MLSRLSNDALSEALSLLGGRDIGRLWLCGDSALNHRLGSGGCVKSFRLPLDSLFPTQWPSLVRHFSRLEEFLIRLEHGEIIEADWTPKYSDLSRTVRKVNFCLHADFDAFLATLKSGHTFDHIEEITGIQITTGSTDETEKDSQDRVIQFFGLVPSLRAVTFNQDGFLSVAPRYWPRSLRSIAIDIQLSDNETLDFPDTLEELVIYLGLSGEGESERLLSANWPSNLVKANLFSDDNIMSHEDIQRLPRRMTDLNLDMNELIPNEAFIKALPPALLCLRFNMREHMKDTKLIELLPRTLTRADMLPPMTAENFKFFPPSLTLVRIGNVPALYGLLPAGIREVRVEEASSTEYGPETKFPKLPDSLTAFNNLNLRYLDQHPLPANLRDLSLRAPDLTEEQAKQFSSSILTNLCLTSSSLAIASIIVPYLPQTLTKLVIRRCENITWDASDVQSLPQTLIDFEVGSVTLTGEKPLSYLPRRLERLHLTAQRLLPGCLGQSDFCPELSFLNFVLSEPPDGLAAYLFAMLPRKLKYFRLFTPATLDLGITDDSLLALPPGLVSLEFSGRAQISGAWQSKRPYPLRHAVFGSKAVARPTPSRTPK